MPDFYKLSGSGNDFVFLDGRVWNESSWPAERIARTCARGTGIGADGLIIIGPGSGSGAVRFTYFNSDGSRRGMCGNGALCATRLAVDLGLAPPEEVRLETESGIVVGRLDPEQPNRAELALQDVAPIRPTGVPPGPGEEGSGVTVVGVEHAVVPVADIEAVNVPNRGRELRRDRRVGPDGANINFVAQGPREWTMRTYERGIEAETLACGTGAVACAAMLASLGRTGLPWSVRSRAGTVLTVSGELQADGGIRNPRLNGEARIICEGVFGPDL